MTLPSASAFLLELINSGMQTCQPKVVDIFPKNEFPVGEDFQRKQKKVLTTKNKYICGTLCQTNNSFE